MVSSTSSAVPECHALYLFTFAFQEMIRFQRHQLEAFLKGVKGPENTEELKAWEDRLMKLRAMKGFS